LDRIIDGKNSNTLLVSIELYLVKIQKKSRRGESGSVRITETKFSTGLARVKAKTLSGSGRVSRVRSGNRDKAFSLYGSGRDSTGSARVRQKLPLGLVLALTLNPGWVSYVSWVNWFRLAWSG
jgi:hypothetical protein